jgi:hypothetical protein
MKMRTIEAIGLAGVLWLLAGLVPARAATTTINSFFNGSEPEMPQRLFRDGSDSTCDDAPFPGIFDTPSFYRTFPFCNPGPDTCFTVDFENGTCDVDVHLEAYANRFDPNDLAANYIGDVGSTEDGPFSFVVPAGATFLLVAQTNFGPANCQYSFTVDAMTCAAPAPALSAAGAGLALAGLALIGALALRRTRTTLAALALLATLGAFAGPAAAPLAAADPTPAPAMSCDLECGVQYKTCARESCDSDEADTDVACLQACRDAFLTCRAGCD